MQNDDLKNLKERARPEASVRITKKQTRLNSLSQKSETEKKIPRENERYCI